MNVLLLGGSGLIGTAALAQLLADGAYVTVLSRKPRTSVPHLSDAVRWIQGDILDYHAVQHAVASAQAEGVIHLAAHLMFACKLDPKQAVETNVVGTMNVLEACRANGVQKLVFGSSIAVYGERNDLMREDDPPPASISLYGETKRLGEMLGSRYADLYGLEFVALRYSGVFGPAQVKSPGMALVRQKLKETARGQDVTLQDVSGDETCHLTYVSDAAAATIRALVCPHLRRNVYNVAGPEANYINLRQFHAAVARIAPHAGNAHFTGRGPSAGPVDTTWLREDMDFVARYSVDDGLREELG